jgi:hypothetical protein
LDARKDRGMMNDSEAFMGRCMIRYDMMGHDRRWDLAEICFISFEHSGGMGAFLFSSLLFKD